MDLFDKAQELEMSEREYCLSETLRAAPILPPKGECLFCETPLPSPLRFCDVECCRDWEREQDAKVRNQGKAVHSE